MRGKENWAKNTVEQTDRAGGWSTTKVVHVFRLNVVH